MQDQSKHVVHKKNNPLFKPKDIDAAIGFLGTDRFRRTTTLCELMDKYGSDKGESAPWGKFKGHRYGPFYDFLFSPIRDQQLKFFELGIGTTDEEMISNMTASGSAGASLYAWQDYFPNSQIFGADIDKQCLFHRERISTYYCNQLDPLSIKKMLEDIGEEVKFDVVIEDGLHRFESSLCFFFNTIHRIQKGGLFIIEDIDQTIVEKYMSILSLLKVSFSLSKIEMVNIPDIFANRNTDNRLLIILK